MERARLRGCTSGQSKQSSQPSCRVRSTQSLYPTLSTLAESTEEDRRVVGGFCLSQKWPSMVLTTKTFSRTEYRRAMQRASASTCTVMKNYVAKWMRALCQLHQNCLTDFFSSVSKPPLCILRHDVRSRVLFAASSCGSSASAGACHCTAAGNSRDASRTHTRLPSRSVTETVRWRIYANWSGHTT
jgi:hypothetical protein